MAAPRIANSKALMAIKAFEISPVVFKNTGDVVTEVSINPKLPLGFRLSIENKTCVIRGTPLTVSPRDVYTVTASNADGSHTATIEINVSEAPFKTQRGEIIHVHEARHDLETPRSQVDNALSDHAMMGSMIKPHDKFSSQPMGDDKRLSQQTANNPDAENRAQNSPDLTPSPTQQLQAQAVARAKPPALTPTPTA